ncbi:GntR family transcriptional regulator [Niabella defluvii]|nr:GntR family transcriptional regulator [Niabella sp. I65]
MSDNTISTNSVFQSVENHTLVDKVEKKLIDLLHQQKLKVGDSIPKEVELATSLGVSRTVIREALMRLRLMGLIDTRKKKRCGYY